MINNEGANFIIARLEKFGYEVYYVGGCVRNALLSLPIFDYDLTTNALPEKICEIFSDCEYFTNGIKHGTVSIVLSGEVYEITTFRKESEYLDYRHPSIVEFCNDIHEDLARRDFTINSLAYNKNTGIIDDFGGIYDIQSRVLKCVNDPEKRFQEDALRILRGIRLASVYSLSVEKNTARAMLAKRTLISNISVERILSEFSKAIIGDNVFTVFNDFKEVIFQIFPEINVEEIDKIFKAISISEKDKTIRFALLFVFAKEKLESIFKRLKFDSKTAKSLTLLYSCLNFNSYYSREEIKKFLNRAESIIQLFFKVKILLAKAFDKQDDLSGIANMQIIYNEIIGNVECFSIKDLAINGNDLQNLGYEGIDIKEKLNYLLNEVICERLENSKEILLEQLKKDG